MHGNSAPVQRVDHHEYGYKMVAIIALILAAMALMGMLFAMYVAREAKAEAEVATMRNEGMARAMIAHGIKDTYPHLQGEDD